MVKPSPLDQKINREKEIDQKINQGAPVKEDVKIETVKGEKWKLVPIRMPEKLLREIDKKIENRIGLSRNAWVLEAIQEKLED
jgi:hypothetical protein